jgi:transcriptional regulator GlxA family with amidase domain
MLMPASPSVRRASTADARRAIFNEAAAIVATDLARPLTVDEVARRVATSPRQLRRSFAESGGVSFRAFVTNLRMRRAAALLLTTDVPVTEVAYTVGYRDASQFTKAFKRAHGRSPTQWRSSTNE